MGRSRSLAVCKFTTVSSQLRSGCALELTPIRATLDCGHYLVYRQVYMYNELEIDKYGID